MIADQMKLCNGILDLLEEQKFVTVQTIKGSKKLHLNIKSYSEQVASELAKAGIDDPSKAKKFIDNYHRFYAKDSRDSGVTPKDEFDKLIFDYIKAKKLLKNN